MTVPESVGTGLGRYLLFDELASGGMAVIHLGVLSGAVGFARTVAIKRLHPHFARHPEFVAMFVDEAKLASRIRHPNVVAPTDVVASDGELFLVMDYVLGESLGGLLQAARRSGTRVPPAVAVRIAADALFGLHAAHEATDEHDEPLRIIHRDVSPENILVGADGVARVLDFGIAKATVRLQSTREGQLKGKLRYMPPEQLQDRELSPRGDVYSASVVLWETLTGRRLHIAKSEAGIVNKILNESVPAPSRLLSDVPEHLDAVVLRGLSKEASERFATAREMAIALERALAPAPAREVADWVRQLMGDELDRRAERVRVVERSSAGQSGQPTPRSALAGSSSEPPPLTEPLPVSVRPGLLPLRRGRTAETRTQTMAANVAKLADRPVAESALAPPPRRRAAIAFGLVAAVVVLLLLLVRQRFGDADEVSVEAAAQQPAGAQVAPTPVILEPPQPPPAESAAPRAESSAPAPVVKPRSAPAPIRTGKVKRPNCNPPWVEDKRGFRTVKRECL
jgi:serine/threonine-protein kinase